jgi:hypothetical protein
MTKFNIKQNEQEVNKNISLLLNSDMVLCYKCFKKKNRYKDFKKSIFMTTKEQVCLNCLRKEEVLKEVFGE